MKYIFFSIILLTSWNNYILPSLTDFHEKFNDQVERSDCQGLKNLFETNFYQLNTQDITTLVDKINNCLTLPAYHRNQALLDLRYRAFQRNDALKSPAPAPTPSRVDSRFTDNVDRTNCAGLKELFAQSHATILAEKDLVYLRSKIDACLSSRTDRELEQLSYNVLNRIYALRYLRARNACSWWFVINSEFSE